MADHKPVRPKNLVGVWSARRDFGDKGANWGHTAIILRVEKVSDADSDGKYKTEGILYYYKGNDLDGVHDLAGEFKVTGKGELKGIGKRKRFTVELFDDNNLSAKRVSISFISNKNLNSKRRRVVLRVHNLSADGKKSLTIGCDGPPDDDYLEPDPGLLPPDNIPDSTIPL